MFLKSKEVEQLTTGKYPKPYTEICSRGIKPGKGTWLRHHKGYAKYRTSFIIFISFWADLKGQIAQMILIEITMTIVKQKQKCCHWQEKTTVIGMVLIS